MFTEAQENSAALPPEDDYQATEKSPPPDPLDVLLRQWRELQTYLHHWLTARIDKVTVRVRLAAIVLAGAFLFALLAAVALATAVVLLMLGLSHVIGDALARPWAGHVIVGGGLLLIFGIAAGGGWFWIRYWSLTKTRKRYDNLQQEQRSRFGRSAGDFATEP